MVVTFREYCYSQNKQIAAALQVRDIDSLLRGFLTFCDGWFMKKIVWMTLGIALVLVNVAAELVFYFTGFTIVMIFRITLVLGITAIAAIFVGANLLIRVLEEEKPLSGHVRDTIGADRKKS
jgi:hypothetical protein